LQICIMSPILPEMGAIYPGTNFVSTDGAASVLRAMNKKECDVGILAANDIRRAMSGEFNEEDCKNSQYRDACIKDKSGKPAPTRDCSQWAAIGNPVLIMPLSLPITKPEVVREKDIIVPEGYYRTTTREKERERQGYTSTPAITAVVYSSMRTHI